MTEELKISIESLYTTFARYPFRSTIEGCPCCVSNTDKEKLHTKQLRQLDGEDLSRYASKAMTTWGDVDDFKHYLPRIFELLATTDFIVDTFIVLGKLEYGKWESWAIEEQNSIRGFLLAWWTDVVKNKSYFDKEAFLEIYERTGDMQVLLDRWEINFVDNSFKNFIEFVFDDYYNLINKQNSFKKMDSVVLDKIINWINSLKQIVESGFFHFATTDTEFAEKISNTLYILEQTQIIK